jgi:hypothetical protein
MFVELVNQAMKPASSRGVDSRCEDDESDPSDQPASLWLMTSRALRKLAGTGCQCGFMAVKRV